MWHFTWTLGLCHVSCLNLFGPCWLKAMCIVLFPFLLLSSLPSSSPLSPLSLHCSSSCLPCFITSVLIILCPELYGACFPFFLVALTEPWQLYHSIQHIGLPLRSSKVCVLPLLSLFLFSVSVSISLPLSLSLVLFFSFSLSFSLFLYFSLPLFLFSSISIFLYFSAFLSLYISVCLYIFLF